VPNPFSVRPIDTHRKAYDGQTHFLPETDLCDPVCGGLGQGWAQHPAGQGAIWLKVNGQTKQSAKLSQRIWSVAEQIAKLSEAFELFPGDIIYSGTPENVGPVVVGDIIDMHVDGLPGLSVKIV